MPSQGQDHAAVLVVEKDSPALETIQTILNEGGYDVCSVSYGQDCLACVRRNLPALILMDISASCGECVETCRQIKADPALGHIPVVIITASTDESTLEAALASGASDFIRKPLNRVEVLVRVNLVLNSGQAMTKHAEAERLKHALETAGGVCHSLNQPLQYVLGAVQILLMDTPADDKMFNILDKIRQKIEQMGTITRKLAEVTRCLRKDGSGGQKVPDAETCIEKL